MPPPPKFSELQAVRILRPTPADSPWNEGIVVDRRWEQAEAAPVVGRPHADRWIYEVQIGDGVDLFELWYAEDDLVPR